MTTDYKPCSICTDPSKREFVMTGHMGGVSPNRLETLSRSTIGMAPIKAETIRRHIRVCLPRSFAPSATTAINPTPGHQREVQRAARTDVGIAKVLQGGAPSGDVATEVQRQVMEKLASGEARVTVQHGLQAQQILDRREERAKDRALAITLTRMLHGQSAPTTIIDVTPDHERDLEPDVPGLEHIVGTRP